MNKLANYKVEKRNLLNELRSNSMTLQQLRLFGIYLAKINPRDTSTRRVTFKLEDYCQIMNLGRPKIDYIQKSTNELLSKVVNIPNENGKGYKAFQLFKECEVYQDETDKEWYITIDAHDNALPLMFDIQKEYFTYKVWNILSLKSPNQIRMYEILKQYETIGTRELSITDLRELIGISPDEYIGRGSWANFKTRIIDACQKALKESTDICFDYERGSVGPGGSWQTIIFHIKRNEDYINNLSIEEFLKDKKETEENILVIDKITELCKEKLISKLNGIQLGWIKTWVNEYKYTEEIVALAFDNNSFRNNLSMKNINDTLIKWHENNISTVEAAKEFCENEHKKNIRNAARNKKTNNSVWRTGEEAGIVCKQSELSNSKEDEVENDEDIDILRSIDDTEKREEKTIPESVLGMFGDSDIDDDPDI